VAGVTDIDAATGTAAQADIVPANLRRAPTDSAGEVKEQAADTTPPGATGSHPSAGGVPQAPAPNEAENGSGASSAPKLLDTGRTDVYPVNFQPASGDVASPAEDHEAKDCVVHRVNFRSGHVEEDEFGELEGDDEEDEDDGTQ
jgi:hypothetical protein